MIFLAGGVIAVTTALLATLAAGCMHNTADRDRDTDSSPTAAGTIDPRIVEELEGEYPANECGTSDRSLYLQGGETAEIEHDEDGYFYVRLRAANGDIVGTGHRAIHRIRGALEGGEGYDYVARADGGRADGA